MEAASSGRGGQKKWLIGEEKKTVNMWNRADSDLCVCIQVMVNGKVNS